MLHFLLHRKLCSKIIEMAKDKTTLRFWLRTDRPNKDGSAPVHLIYQIQGQRKYFSIPGIRLFSINWDPKTQQAIYLDKKAAKKKDPSFDPKNLLTASEMTEINSKLEVLKVDINDVETRFKLDKKTFSPQMVIEALRQIKKPETKIEQPGIFIIDFINRFCAETNDHKEGTLKAYSGLANHMANYEALKKTKFTFDGDASILRGFSSYLTSLTRYNKTTGKEERSINNITKAKLFGTFKTIVRYAMRAPYKYQVNPDFIDYKEKSLKRRDSEFEIIALTNEELQAIIDLDLSDNRSLDEARDILVFSASTGLRYGDLKQLSRKHIRKDNTIYIPASDKNSKVTEIPLNSISFSIIQKYKHLATPLPVTPQKNKLISDQKLNVHIQKIAKLAGIDSEIEIVRPYGSEDISLGVFKKHELLSIHSMRKTFVTLSLEKGIPIQDVMALTTHSSFKTVKRYINVTKERKKVVMAEAWGKAPEIISVKKVS